MFSQKPFTLENAIIETESVFFNSTTPMRWMCDKEHIWLATFDSIKHSNPWCPYCTGNVIFTLEDAKQIATEKGGSCLSKKYINKSSSLLF